MMQDSPVKNIKKAQREKLLLRHISKLFMEATQEDSIIRNLTITRVVLSQDKGHCFVYFYTPQGIKDFEEKLNQLKLYKPSLRKSIATSLDFRYVPEITFKFDESFEKQEHVEQLMEQLKREGKL